MLYGWYQPARYLCYFIYPYAADTIYACQDMKDDVKMGVRSTALLFGSWIRPLLITCAVLFVAMLTQAGTMNNQGPAFFILSVGGTALHLIWQFATVNLDEPQSCWSTPFHSTMHKYILIHALVVNFQRNGHLGWTVWGGLVVDYLFRIGIIKNGLLGMHL